MCRHCVPGSISRHGLTVIGVGVIIININTGMTVNVKFPKGHRKCGLLGNLSAMQPEADLYLHVRVIQEPVPQGSDPSEGG
jgi:hypothetical protein